MTTTIVSLDQARNAATVGDVAFLDTINATAIVKQAGSDYATAGAVFFKVAAAVALYVGDDQARTMAKSLWADSKDKSREYFLKVVRAVEAATKQGKRNDVKGVASFSQLQALGKPAPVETSDADDKAAHNGAVSMAEQALTLADAALAAEKEISRLNKATNALETLEALANKVGALAIDEKAIKATSKADLVAMLAELGARISLEVGNIRSTMGMTESEEKQAA